MTNTLSFPDLETSILERAITVADIQVCEITYDEFIQLKPFSLQRDTKPRLKKMAEVFKRQDLPQLAVVDLFYTEQEYRGMIGDTEEILPKGLVNANSNTRQRFYSIPDNKQFAPAKFLAHIWMPKSFQQAKDQYYGFDNLKAAEATKEKITGALRHLGLLGKFQSKVLGSGSFSTALNLAYPGDDKDDILTKVAYMKDVLIDLDHLKLTSPKDKSMRTQAIIAIAIMAKLLYDGNQHNVEGIKRLAEWDYKEKVKTGTGNSAIAKIFHEWNNVGDQRMTENPRSTKRADIPVNMDFLAYAWEIWMDGDRELKLWQQKNAEGKYQEMIDDIQGVRPA